MVFPTLNDLIQDELARAYRKHGVKLWSRHEFYGVLKEEVDEVWDSIKCDRPTDELLREIVQVAGVCQRYFDTGDRYRGAHPTLTLRGAA